MARAVAVLLLLAAAGCGPSLRPVQRVVLMTIDTTRADRIGAYGYDQGTTPHIDSLADQGVVFENAYSPVPTTLPSHSTMLTGLYPPDHKVQYNLFFKLPDSVVTLPEILQEHGFRTAALPSSHILSQRFGLNQGFDHWAEPPKQEADDDGGHSVSKMRPAEDGVDLAIEWLEEQGSDQPSFLWLHMYDPHWPYTPPFPYNDRYRDRPYDGEIAYTDAQIGRLLQMLRDDPAWDRTLVILAADHGEGLFDHGEQYHAMLVYDTTQHVPLIIRTPGGRAGRRAPETVSLVDLTPTILDLVGIDRDPELLRGRSLAPALRGDELAPRDAYFETIAGAIAYGWQELQGLRYGKWKLIDSREPELYDLENDPEEQENLARLQPDRVTELRGVLAEMKQSILEDLGDATIELDPETEAKLRGLGYVGGDTSAGGSNADAPHPRDLIGLQTEMVTGQSLVQRGDHIRALDLCEYVLSKDPLNRWALQTGGNALMMVGRYDEAREYSRRMIEAAPTSEQAYVLAGRIESRAGRPEAAFQVLSEGLQALSEELDAPPSELLTYYQLVSAFEVGMDDVCTEQVPAALRLSEGETDGNDDGAKDSWRLLVLQARCDLRERRTDDALATLERAVALGFSQIGRLGDEQEFAGLAQDPRFRALVEGGSEDDEAADAAFVSGDSPDAAG